MPSTFCRARGLPSRRGMPAWITLKTDHNVAYSITFPTIYRILRFLPRFLLSESFPKAPCTRKNSSVQRSLIHTHEKNKTKPYSNIEKQQHHNPKKLIQLRYRLCNCHLSIFQINNFQRIQRW